MFSGENFPWKRSRNCDHTGVQKGWICCWVRGRVNWRANCQKKGCLIFSRPKHWLLHVLLWLSKPKILVNNDFFKITKKLIWKNAKFIIKNFFSVDATAESNKLGRLVNHSRNGNLVTRIIEVKNKPHLILIAKEDIPPGVELSYDYGDRSKEALRNHPWLAL